MTKQSSPRLDALREMREKGFAMSEQRDRDNRAILQSLKSKTTTAIAKADDASNRRKAKKTKRASRQGQ